MELELFKTADIDLIIIETKLWPKNTELKSGFKMNNFGNLKKSLSDAWIVLSTFRTSGPWISHPLTTRVASENMYADIIPGCHELTSFEICS